jgi:hypothetical protein
MLVALLAGFLLFSGGNGFAAKMFGKDTVAAVHKVVADPARADAAVRTIKQGQKDLEEAGKQFSKITKEFSAADEAQSAGLEVLTPFMQQAFDERRIVQARTLDRMFELRKTLTEDEWKALFATLK